MVDRDGCTLYVDFEHVSDFDYELKEALEMEFYRFEPFLRRGLLAWVTKFEVRTARAKRQQK